jgi:hypothetical protein
MTTFCFEHEFHAATPREILEIYFFDLGHNAEQDRIADIERRELLEEKETPELLERTYKVYPRKQPPVVARPFMTDGPLHYLERVVWKKTEDRIEFDIRPSVAGGRAHIGATYRLAPVGPGRVRRIYEGKATVKVALVGGRIERGIVDELEASLKRTATCTQQWLDRRAGSADPAASPRS